MKQSVWLIVLVAGVAALTVVVVRQRSEIAELKQAATRVLPTKTVEPAEPPAPVAPKEEPVAVVEPPPTPAAASEAPSHTFMSSVAGMMKNPQMKEMVRAQQQMMLERQYGSLFKYLGSRPATDLDALKKLLLDRQMALTDTGLAMMSGSAEERKQAVEDGKAIKAEYDKKVEALLGAQDYDVFKQYEATAGERMQVQMFKESLAAEIGLNDQQENDLILAMAEETKSLPSTSLLKKGNNSDPSQMSEENITEALKQLDLLQERYAERAKAILTPAQLEQFTKWQAQWKTMSTAGLKMAQQMFGSKPAPAVPQQ